MVGWVFGKENYNILDNIIWSEETKKGLGKLFDLVALGFDVTLVGAGSLGLLFISKGVGAVFSGVY